MPHSAVKLYDLSFYVADHFRSLTLLVTSLWDFIISEISTTCALKENHRVSRHESKCLSITCPKKLRFKYRFNFDSYITGLIERNGR